MASSLACSIDECKRAATCLCHHCCQNVCFKHLSEHQTEINKELMPLTDRLNELKMKLQTTGNENETLAGLKIWRDKKHKEIDEEYDQRVREFNTKISKQDEQVTEIIVKIEGLINEGEASYEQVKQLKKEIESLENQVNRLMSNKQTEVSLESAAVESDLVNTYIKIGDRNVLIKGRVTCRGKDLYALEDAVDLIGSDGLCPQCRMAHVVLTPKRGFYFTSEYLRKYIENRMKK